MSTKDGLWLLGLVLLGLTLRLTVIVGASHQPVSDELAYLSMVQSLVLRGEISDLAGNRAMYNVGYPLLVLAPVMAVFGESLTAFRVANALLSILTIVLAYGVARQAGAGVIGARLAAGLCALYLPNSLYTVYLAKENFMTPLMLALVGGGVLVCRSAPYWLALVLGWVAALLALTGNAGLALGAGVAVGLANPKLGWHRRSVFIMAALTTAASVVTPWLVRNQQVVGAAVLNTQAGFNLYLGNNPVATGRFVSIGDTPAAELWQTTLAQDGELAATEALQHVALDWISEHPCKFAELAWRKASLFWTPPWHDGQAPSATSATSAPYEALWRALWCLQYLGIVAAALAGLAFVDLRHRATAVLWAAVAAYTAVHMLFYVVYRYREPIMPLMIVLAALTLEKVWLRWRGRR